MQDQGEAQQSADAGADQGHRRDRIAAPGRQGLEDRIGHTQAKGHQVARIARHVEEKVLHRPGRVGRCCLLATLPPRGWICSMELYQFRHSAFCEKVRLVLAVKRLDYTVVEVSPGLGQLELFRLSGQRQVPVLVDGSEVIADSTAIALYLERHQPEPQLLPVAGPERARVLLVEDWADTALAAGCRLALVQAAATDAQLRSALLPDSTPGPLRQLVTSLPSGMLAGVGEALSSVVGVAERQQLQTNLEQLAVLVADQPYLVGGSLSLADLAVVAQLGLLKFPSSSGAPLAGLGVAGIVDHPLLEPLFSWRDRIAAEAGRG